MREKQTQMKESSLQVLLAKLMSRVHLLRLLTVFDNTHSVQIPEINVEDMETRKL